MNFVSPYMHELKEHRPKIKKRTEEVILQFIGERTIGKALDIGIRNPVTELLEKHYNRSIDSTNIDLDVGQLSGEYDTIFCFEVLEHLFNPLHFLLEAKKVLKDDGTIFLSTPKGRPHFLAFTHHFHEFYKSELIALIERAGMKIVRLQYYRIRPLSMSFGFRPFLRVFFDRKCMVEIKKSDQKKDL